MSDASSHPNVASTSAEGDQWQWLEDIHGEKPLDWVKQQNRKTLARFGSGEAYQRTRDRVLEVLDSDARIPAVGKRGEYFYNFWRDKDHPRGLWRRTTLDEYRKEQPRWEVLLDVDALGQQEGKRWVWHGAGCLAPDYQRCLINLSPDGGDARAVREFDLASKTFVEGGFELPAAKSNVNWRDRDHLYVATDFGAGSMTTSGYPRIVKLWQRGTPLSSAKVVFEGEPQDLTVMGGHDFTKGFERDFFHRQRSFFEGETFWRTPEGELQKIEIPADADASPYREWLLISLRSDWQVAGQHYPAGSLLAAKFDDFMAGKRDLVKVFTPTATRSLAGYSTTRHHLLLNEMDNVAGRLEVVTPGQGEWQRRPLGDDIALSSISAGGVDDEENDDYWLSVEGFLKPATLYYGSLDSSAAPDKLKQAPAFFDASRYQVQQHFATSRDGTRIPYFEIAAKDIQLDGRNPTLLYGYGGFEVSLTPDYSGSIGRSWLERGGVYVIANIRGGGEYGPGWHQAALKQHRMRAYEDFAAVASDLTKRGVTSAQHLGAEGGSNGGLLAGNMLTHYPQLFGAIVSEVPLLDMKRYTHLSAGASWIGEYGDPDQPDQWQFIRTFSPYHNIDANTHYPPVLFYTATSDDRVGPVQARKMAAKMQDMGIQQVWFYENTEGGHGASVDNRQSAERIAMTTQFLWDNLTASE
ncbi:prolyl oligopeptidase family serine peptidase [Carnimonas bestiolae]|uniref:prolyl oligopeptidase family serine peptidase n=1 Tax=Carnimonas bestiolae TaxID=3402172 RepID=UPI003EDB75CF